MDVVGLNFYVSISQQSQAPVWIILTYGIELIKTTVGVMYFMRVGMEAINNKINVIVQNIGNT